jgi:hydrogenase maturation protease
MRTIILGVGNPILCDDGVGIHIIRELRKHVKRPDVKIEEATTSGINLIEMMLGYDKAIIVDTLKMENEPVGEVKRLSIDDLPNVYPSNPHDIGLPAALELMKKLGEDQIPREIIVIGVVVGDKSISFGETISPKVANAIPKAIEMILLELGEKRCN